MHIFVPLPSVCFKLEESGVTEIGKCQDKGQNYSTAKFVMIDQFA